MSGAVKLSVEVLEAEARAVSDALEANGLIEPDAVTQFEVAGTDRWLVEAYFPADGDRALLRRLLAGLTAGGAAPAGARLVEVAGEDWAAKVQRDLAPIRAGRFLVHGSHDRQARAVRRYSIEIDAGQAFGTAHHATTALCLEAIDALAKRERFSSILDLGCGTAVLAIAATRAWPAASIMASDVDPIATAIARQNAVRNEAARNICCITAPGLRHAALRPRGAFDLILANILAAPLTGLAPAMSRALQRGGIAILSGLLEDQATAVVASYKAARLKLVALRRRDGWAAIVMRKR
jgi:ribosomal protein L11 methyltransferase